MSKGITEVFQASEDPCDVIVRQDTVLDDGKTVTNMIDITTVNELTYVRDALNKALCMMKGAH